VFSEAQTSREYPYCWFSFSIHLKEFEPSKGPSGALDTTLLVLAIGWSHKIQINKWAVEQSVRSWYSFGAVQGGSNSSSLTPRIRVGGTALPHVKVWRGKKYWHLLINWCEIMDGLQGRRSSRIKQLMYKWVYQDKQVEGSTKPTHEMSMIDPSPH
jgi:hypothetical protein